MSKTFRLPLSRRQEHRKGAAPPAPKGEREPRVKLAPSPAEAPWREEPPPLHVGTGELRKNAYLNAIETGTGVLRRSQPRERFSQFLPHEKLIITAYRFTD